MAGQRERCRMPEVKEKIMQVIIRSPGSSLEEIILECPGLTWNQVFSEIDGERSRPVWGLPLNLL